MGLTAESFTLLAVLEARDMASAIYDKVQGRVDEFSGSMKAAADVATEAGAKIDESFMTTASGADALELATARVDAAQGKLAASTKAQADAERGLLEANAQAATAADGDAAAMDRQIAASDALTKAQKSTADATKGLKDAQATQTTITDAQTASSEKAAVAADTGGGKLSSMAGTMGKVGLGMALASGLMVKSAGDFQSSTTHLVTDAGESASQLGKVQAGMLGISSATGTSSKDVVAGMYHIESSIPPMADASKRASLALGEMTTAAQGAKVGGADLGTVSVALAGSLNAYSVKGYSATQMMNGLIATTGAGDVKMQDLASSLSNITGVAASAGLDFSQVGGAIATMTSQGWTAQRATQDLASAVSSLGNPQKVAATEMAQLGLSANDVANNLGKRGLTGTMDVLTQAVASHTKGGQVLIDTLKSSQVAGANAAIMFKELPKSIDGAATSLMNGSTTAADFNKSIAGLDAPQQHLAKQFETLIKNSGSFNNLLTSNSPAAQTYNAAMAKMLGGTTGLNAALAISGGHMDTFKSSTGTVSTALKSTGTDVTNWSTIQGTFNQKMAVAKTSVENTGTAIGTALLPAVTSIVNAVMSVVGPIASWVEKHQHLSAIILGSIAGFALLVGSVNLLAKGFGAVKSAVSSVGAVVDATKKVLMTFTGTVDTSAASADGAAASMDGLAASTDAETASTEANTVASDASSGSWIMAGLSAAGAAAKFVIVKAAQLAVTTATYAWTAAQWLFNAAMDANPIGVVILAIAALAAGVYYAYTHFQDFRNVVKAVWDWMKGAVTDVIDFVRDHWRLILEILTGPIGLAVALITNYWGDIKRFFSDGVHDVEGIISWFGSLPAKFGKWLDDTTASVGRGLASAVAWFTGLPGRVATAVTGYFAGLGADFSKWLAGVSSSVSNGIDNAIAWFKGLPGRVVSGLGNMGTLLWNAGADVIRGFVGGIKSVIGDVKSTLSNITNDLTSWKGPPSKDAVLLVDNGALVMKGFMSGIDSQLPALHAKLGGVTASVSTSVGSTAPALPATSSVGGGGGMTVVNINMKDAFNGAHVMSDRGMDDLVTKMGRALATTILPAGGLRVAM